MANKNKDTHRKWMWWFLGAIAALQLYFVRELLVAFAVFAIGFAAVATMLAVAYLAKPALQLAVARSPRLERRAVSAALRQNATEKAA